MDDKLKAAFVEAAQVLFNDEGTLEIDDNAAISTPDDPDDVCGAYVQAWVWVGNPECAECGEDIEGLPTLPTNAGNLSECLCSVCAIESAKISKPSPQKEVPVMNVPKTLPSVVDEIFQTVLEKIPSLRSENTHLCALLRDVLRKHLGPVTARTMDTTREDIEKARNILEDVMRHFNSECRRLSQEEHKDCEDAA